MPGHAYHFVTTWQLDAPPEAVYDVLSVAEDLPRWCPAVYLAVTPRSPATNPDGTGATFALHTKGWLPYTLRWTLTATEAERPTRLALTASGDFEGTGLWTLRRRPDGGTTAEYDWRIVANKPLLRWLSPLLRPVFAANHEWAMRQALAGLTRELARRGARGE